MSKPESSRDFFRFVLYKPLQFYICMNLMLSTLCATGSFKLFRGDRKAQVRDFFDIVSGWSLIMHWKSSAYLILADEADDLQKRNGL